MAKKKEETKGVLLIAHGHPMYAHYAYNLAVSLKNAERSIDITLITSGNCTSQLSEEKLSIFDNIKQAKAEWIEHKTGANYLLNKLYLDKATPYDKTIFMDVDLAWNIRRNPLELFALLDGCTFQPVIYDYINCKEYQSSSNHWMDYSQLFELYGIESTPDLSSEIIYYTKDTDVFAKARKVYDENKINVRSFSGAKPDEPYLSAGYSQSKEQVKLLTWIPTYWQNRYFTKFRKDADILSEFYAISAGGNVNAKNTERLYNTLIGASFNGMGINETPYKLQHKRNVLKKERQLI